MENIGQRSAKYGFAIKPTKKHRAIFMCVALSIILSLSMCFCLCVSVHARGCVWERKADWNNYWRTWIPMVKLETLLIVFILFFLSFFQTLIMCVSIILATELNLSEWVLPWICHRLSVIASVVPANPFQYIKYPLRNLFTFYLFSC